jgi:hypothetical protein
MFRGKIEVTGISEISLESEGKHEKWNFLNRR